MKNALVILILLSVVSAVAEELKMPSAVRYETLSSQSYRVTITGLLPKTPPPDETISQEDSDSQQDPWKSLQDPFDFVPDKQENDLDDSSDADKRRGLGESQRGPFGIAAGKQDAGLNESVLEELFYSCIRSDCTNFTTDLQAKTLSFVLTNHLTNVVQVVNDLARWRKIPFWEELLMRDEKSASGCTITYKLSDVSRNKPNLAGLELKPVPNDAVVRFPFRYAKDTLGFLVFNRSTGHCIMGENCFSLRICEPSGNGFGKILTTYTESAQPQFST